MLEWGNLEHHIKNLKRSVGEVVEIILFDKFSCTWWIALLLHSRKQKLGFAFNSQGLYTGSTPYSMFEVDSL